MVFFLLQSGAKINISDGSCPERIVTISGTTEAIYKAFSLICTKVEEVSSFSTSFCFFFCRGRVFNACLSIKLMTRGMDIRYTRQAVETRKKFNGFYDEFNSPATFFHAKSTFIYTDTMFFQTITENRYFPLYLSKQRQRDGNRALNLALFLTTVVIKTAK